MTSEIISGIVDIVTIIALVILGIVVIKESGK